MRWLWTLVYEELILDGEPAKVIKQSGRMSAPGAKQLEMRLESLAGF